MDKEYVLEKLAINVNRYSIIEALAKRVEKLGVKPNESNRVAEVVYGSVPQLKRMRNSELTHMAKDVKDKALLVQNNTGSFRDTKKLLAKNDNIERSYWREQELNSILEDNSFGLAGKVSEKMKLRSDELKKAKDAAYRADLRELA